MFYKNTSFTIQNALYFVKKIYIQFFQPMFIKLGKYAKRYKTYAKKNIILIAFLFALTTHINFSWLIFVKFSCFGC